MIRKYRLWAVILALFSVSPAKATFTLAVSTQGPSSPSIIVSTPAGINCGSTNTTCSASFAAGSTVTLAEVSGSTVVFAGWGGYGPCQTNLALCPVLMNAGQNLTAQFNPILSLSLSGVGAGSVMDSSGTIICASTNTCALGAATTASYYPGAYIVLTATAATNSTFTGWSGGTCSGSSLTCGFNMTKYQVVIATFASGGPFGINVSLGGTGKGSVTSSPAGINCGGVCTSTFSINTAVTLTATAAAGYSFVGWSNAGCSGTGTCVINSTSTAQGLGGAFSPSATFY